MLKEGTATTTADSAGECRRRQPSRGASMACRCSHSQLSIVEGTAESAPMSTTRSQVVRCSGRTRRIAVDRSRLFNTDQSEVRAIMRADLVVPNPLAVVRITQVIVYGRDGGCWIARVENVDLGQRRRISGDGVSMRNPLHALVGTALAGDPVARAPGAVPERADRERRHGRRRRRRSRCRRCSPAARCSQPGRGADADQAAPADRAGHLRRRDRPSALRDPLALPNPEMTAYQFKHALQWQLLTYGRAYAEIVRVDGRVVGALAAPLRIHARRPRRRAAETLDVSAPAAAVSPGCSTPSQPPILELTHDRRSCAAGTSSARRWRCRSYVAKFFANGAQPGGVLQAAGKLTLEQKQRCASNGRRSIGGSANAHKTADSRSGLKFKTLAMDERQRADDRDDEGAQHGDLRRLPRAAVEMPA